MPITCDRSRQTRNRPKHFKHACTHKHFCERNSCNSAIPISKRGHTKGSIFWVSKYVMIPVIWILLWFILCFQNVVSEQQYFFPTFLNAIKKWGDESNPLKNKAHYRLDLLSNVLSWHLIFFVGNKTEAKSAVTLGDSRGAKKENNWSWWWPESQQQSEAVRDSL